VSSREALAAAAAFSVCLFAVELAMFRSAYYSDANGVGYVAQLVHAPTWKWLLLQIGLVTWSVLTFILFVHTTIVGTTPTQIAGVGLFAVANVIEYSAMTALARGTDAADIRQFLIVNDVGVLLHDGTEFLSQPAVLPATALVLLQIRYRTVAPRASGARLAVVLGAMLVAYVATANVPPWVQVYRDYIKYPLPAFNGVWRTLADYTRVAAQTVDGPRGAVPAATGPPPQRNVVFIVDESVRADRLSLNGYARDTTPFLVGLERAGMLQNWGIASAIATCSDAAHALLMTGLRVDDLPTTDAATRRTATIFQYAKALGYRTHYLDGSMKTWWSLRPQDAPFVNDWKGSGSFGTAPDNDLAIARAVRDLVTGSRGHFVWVTKVGAHFHYNTRFADAAAVWRPYASAIVGNDDPVPVDNAYDNALRYSVDGFFRALLAGGRVPDDTVILYTSDHAETIVPDVSRAAPHCGTAREQAMVPLFLLGYSGPVDTGFGAGHGNVFATLLDLLGWPDRLRLRPYELSLLRASGSDSKPRYYVGPFLHAAKRLPFDSSARP
jgi:glucan phosphoethanolaminetransferase (alkaline phosphatase superfamily)